MLTGACSNAGLCELLISPIGVGLSSSGSVACGGRERGWWELSAELSAELAACGCAAAPFPAWSGCLAACFSGNISLVLPWLQELLRHGTGETHMSRGEQFLPRLVQLRRSRNGTGFVEGSLHKSILVLGEECFFLPIFLPMIHS